MLTAFIIIVTINIWKEVNIHVLTKCEISAEKV